MAFEVESYFKEKLQRLASVCVSEDKLEAAVGAAWGVVCSLAGMHY